MKKQNRNILAYAKHSAPNLNASSAFLQIDTDSANQTIYQSVISQMNSDNSQYIKKVVSQNNRQQLRNEKKLRNTKNGTNHERVKSYFNQIVSTPTASDLKNSSKNFSHRRHEKTTNNLFYSNQITPTNKKNLQNEQSIFSKKIEEQKTKKYKSSNSFINSLDGYLEELTQQSGLERKTRLKPVHREQNWNAGNLQKIENMKNKIKELKLGNHILQNQNEKWKKKQEKIKIKNKQKMQAILEYLHQLTAELENQRAHRKKLEFFINDVQNKFSCLKPPKKSLNSRSDIEEYLASETTEQDEINYNYDYLTDFQPKHLNKYGRGKQSRLTGLTREEPSNYGERQLEISDQQDENSSFGI